jgi:hypothetical protein
LFEAEKRILKLERIIARNKSPHDT